MSGAASDAEATRARPQSGGLWALLSWLRRDDDSAASSDSLSSVGSDRTVASFAYLAPDRYRHPAAPVLLPPPGPPTDSYKRRLRDRNSRLQHDRDLTLHRKYGLYRGENNGYDAFSLPPARKLSENKDREERDRRAASEGLQRRAAYVPGKRRAPLPPVRAATLGAPRRSLKRPAPQPPRRPLSEVCRNATIPEESLSTQIGQSDLHLRKTENMDQKPEKYVKKDPKPRTEKSFLKQIFESRKRNSAVDPIPERILPSISELDKQAAEIIESCKLKALDRSDETNAGTSRELVTPSRGDMWFCTRCLRKYNDSVVTCGHCVTEQKMKFNLKASGSDRSYTSRPSNHHTQTEGTNTPSKNGVNEEQEKQKLKEMLKEIKDSLPKRQKHENKNTNNSATTNEMPPIVEAPTLKIGSKIFDEEERIQKANSKLTNGETESNFSDLKVILNTTSTSATETAVVTHPIVLQHIPSRDIIKIEHFSIANLKQDKSSTNLRVAPSEKVFTPNAITKESIIPDNENKRHSESSASAKGHLYIPLKVSSLLNSNPLTKKELSKDTLSKPGNQQQKTATSSSEATPLVSSSNLLANTSPQKIKPPSPTAESKVVPKTSLTSPAEQNVLKANSTTQTSSNVFLDISAKSQNAASILDQANYKPSNFELETGRKNASSKQTIRSVLSEAYTGTSTAPGLHLQNNKLNGDQQKKPLEHDARCEVLKSDNSRASDNRERNPSAKSTPYDLHSRRRDLINRLEQSIAKGDEQAAADAAAKLAQLRLSCSVLSFSSQIVGAPPTSPTGPLNKINNTVIDKVQREADKVTITNKHVNPTKSPDRLQKTALDGVTASSSKISIEKKIVQTQHQSGAKEKKIISANNKHQILIEPSTSKKNEAAGNENISIEVWIEDREAARGPIRMNMPRASVMGDLRRQANTSFGLASHLQRWIVGRTLCTDDNTPLNSLAGPKFDAPFYLCLVEPETNNHTAARAGSTTPNSRPDENNKNIDQTNGENKATDVYAELVLLERRALVPNAEEFECEVCMEQYNPGQGAVLRECVHTFCKECLSDVVKHSEEPAVSCPAMGCPGFLHEREIRALVSPEDYERWLARGLAAAESGTRNAFHCRTRDCQGWALCEPGVTRFPCPVCKRTNCVSCQAIHEGDTCEQYRAKQRESEAASSAPEETDEGTRAFLDTLISRGEALECPECSAIITKKWGCDWIKCSACKTEICWVTRGRRWGPGGRGDTSAGCRCGVDGKRCHPSCGYCH